MPTAQPQTRSGSIRMDVLVGAPGPPDDSDLIITPTSPMCAARAPRRPAGTPTPRAAPTTPESCRATPWCGVTDHFNAVERGRRHRPGNGSSTSRSRSACRARTRPTPRSGASARRRRRTCLGCPPPTGGEAHGRRDHPDPGLRRRPGRIVCDSRTATRCSPCRDSSSHDGQLQTDGRFWPSCSAPWRSWRPRRSPAPATPAPRAPPRCGSRWSPRTASAPRPTARMGRRWRSPSCNPPGQTSSYSDGGHAGRQRSGGQLRGVPEHDRGPRAPPGPPDDSDLLVKSRISDVRCKTGSSGGSCRQRKHAQAGADYSGELLGTTDHPESATTTTPSPRAAARIPQPWSTSRFHSTFHA